MIESKVKNSEAIVLAIAKNIEKSIVKDYTYLNEIFNNVFKKVDWFVVESNSTDKSYESLIELKDKVNNFEFVTLDHSKKETHRIIAMAAARNRCLDEVLTNKNYSNADYVIVLDLNRLNNELTVEGIKSCFDKTDWDVCTANQLGPYYDIWALRHPDWSPTDCWKSLEFFRKYYLFPEKALFVALHSKMIKIGRDSEWIQTHSSFGGLAIYKKDIFVKSRYSAYNEFGEIICEHVPFHLKLHGLGYKIFINPNMINTRYTNHSTEKKLYKRILRIMMYIPKFFRKYV